MQNRKILDNIVEGILYFLHNSMRHFLSQFKYFIINLFNAIFFSWSFNIYLFNIDVHKSQLYYHINIFLLTIITVIYLLLLDISTVQTINKHTINLNIFLM